MFLRRPEAERGSEATFWPVQARMVWSVPYRTGQSSGSGYGPRDHSRGKLGYLMTCCHTQAVGISDLRDAVSDDISLRSVVIQKPPPLCVS